MSPCRSDYMDPTDQERKSQILAQNVEYVYGELGIDVPKWVEEAAVNSYGNTSRIKEMTQILCLSCKVVEQVEEQAKRIIWDGKSEKARALAEWWQDHQEQDRKRIKESEEEKEKEKLIKTAYDKLTPEEVKALGLDPNGKNI